MKFCFIISCFPAASCIYYLAITYGMNDKGLIPVREGIFISTTTYREALGSPNQWVPEVLSPRVKRRESVKLTSIYYRD
jgi:hypothetical protein